MGAIVHGRVCHGFTFLPNIKHGSNITIETLHRVLKHQFEQNKRFTFTQKMMYLQLDNTTKQCKSQYVLGYLALLVSWYLFRETMVSFLMVGHTHEDIDQMFSRIALWLRKHNATSRIGFREAILEGFKGKWSGKTLAEDIESAANVSDWLNDKLAPMGQKKTGPDLRDGITKFHQFKFSMLKGVVIMRVREWCGDKEGPWTGLTPGSTHHVVFPHGTPSPDDLAKNCPPAQRSTKPTDPAYITTNKKGGIVSNHTSKTRAGVEAIIKNRKIDGAAKHDLHACLELMESEEALPFHWDMTMYNVHFAKKATQALQHKESDLEHQDFEGVVSDESEVEAETDLKEDESRKLDFDKASSDEETLPQDSEGYRPQRLLLGQIHLVRLGAIDWGLAKYVKRLKEI
jgi:hypothetical protein